MESRTIPFERHGVDAHGVLFRPTGAFREIAEAGRLTWSHRRNLHASNFADIELAYHPANLLSVQFAVAWPPQLSAPYVGHLQMAITSGLYALVEGPTDPYAGIAFLIAGIGWDDVGSSEMAFFRAARDVAQHLITTRPWRSNLAHSNQLSDA